MLPLLNKAGLDRSSPANYRPISNLSTVSNVLERLVLARLRLHLTNAANFSKRQSAYRQGHSTETTLLDVLENVYIAADDKEVTVLIGLDVSAVCHSTLTQRLQTEFGVSGTVLSSVQSYLQDRKQFVKRVSTGRLKPYLKLEYRKVRYSDRCCSPSTAAQLTTLSSTWRCAPTTQMTACPFSPRLQYS